jgi:hypothetical protein
LGKVHQEVVALEGQNIGLRMELQQTRDECTSGQEKYQKVMFLIFLMLLDAKFVVSGIKSICGRKQSNDKFIGFNEWIRSTRGFFDNKF